MSESNAVPDDKAVALYHGDVSAETPALLARLQQSKAVRIVADRICHTDPSINNLEGLMVAQAAMATGLSPFPPQPELVWWVGKRSGQRILTMMRGRDGTARLAKENARRAGTYLMDPRFEVIHDETMKLALGFNADDLVVKARVANKREVDDWHAGRVALKDEGLTTDDIDRRLGAIEPASEGYGRLTKDEMGKLDKYEDNKMPHINRAKKRAKVEAEKPWAADISPQALAEGASSDLDAYVIDAEWREIEVEKLTPEEIEARAKEGEEASEALFGTGDAPHDKPKAEPKAKKKAGAPRSASIVQSAFVELIEKHKGLRRNDSLQNVVATHLKGVLPKDEEQSAVLMYLSGKPALDDFTGAELKALLVLLEIQPSAGGHAPSDPAKQEIKNCLMAMQAKEGS